MKAKISSHPLLFLTGYRILKAECEQAESLLNLCTQHGIALLGTELSEDGFFLFCSFCSFQQSADCFVKYFIYKPECFSVATHF